MITEYQPQPVRNKVKALPVIMDPGDNGENCPLADSVQLTGGAPFSRGNDVQQNIITYVRRRSNWMPVMHWKLDSTGFNWNWIAIQKSNNLSSRILATFVIFAYELLHQLNDLFSPLNRLLLLCISRWITIHSTLRTGERSLNCELVEVVPALLRCVLSVFLKCRPLPVCTMCLALCTPVCRREGAQLRDATGGNYRSLYTIRAERQVYITYKHNQSSRRRRRRGGDDIVFSDFGLEKLRCTATTTELLIIVITHSHGLRLDK